MKGKRILSAVLAASTLCMTAVPANFALTASAFYEPAAFLAGSSDSKTVTVSLDLNDIKEYDKTITFEDLVTDGDSLRQNEENKGVFINNDQDRNAILKAIKAKNGDYANNFEMKDIAVSFEWNYVTPVEDAIPNIQVWPWAGGLDKEGQYQDISSDMLDEKGITFSYSSMTGSGVIDTSDLSKATGIELNFIQMGMSYGAWGLDKADVLNFEVTGVDVTVEYTPSVYLDLEAAPDAKYVDVEAILPLKENCAHENHIGDDGVDYSTDSKYCPWCSVSIFGLTSDGKQTESCYQYHPYSGESATVAVTISLDEIKGTVGSNIVGLVFASDCTLGNVELLSSLPDVQLGTGSLETTTIPEAMDWSPEGDIPTGKPDLTPDMIQIRTCSSPTSPYHFNGYKALKLDYTIGGMDDTAAVVVILHGWGDNADTNIGWTELYFEPKESGSVVINLEPYYDLDYYNIFAGVSANPTAQIGDTFAPYFTITDANLLTSCDDAATPQIDPVRPAEEEFITLTAEAGTEEVKLSWNQISKAEKYRVFYRQDGSSWKIVKDTTAEEYTVTGLTGGEEYEFLVRYYDGSTWSKYTDEDIVAATPKAAVKPVVTSVTAGVESVYLKWKPVSDAKSYRVFYRLNGASSWAAYKNTTANEYTVTGLTGGKKYDFLVRSYNGSEWSAYTNADIVNATPKAAVKPTFTSLTPGENSVVLRWNAVSGAKSYRVFYRLSGTSKWSYRNTTVTAMNLMGLTGGKKYDFLVRSYNGSTWSSYNSADIKTATPKVPSNKPVIYSATPGVNSVVLRWNAVEGAKSYRVYYRVSGTTAWTYKNTTKNAMNLTGLTGGKTYEFVVRSYNGSTWTSYSTADIVKATVKS